MTWLVGRYGLRTDGSRISSIFSGVMRNVLRWIVMVAACMHAQSCLTFCGLRDCGHQAPLSMRSSRQEYWSGLSFPSPGHVPNPGIEPRSPTLQEEALSSEPPGKTWSCNFMVNRLGKSGNSSRFYFLGLQNRCK